ncbi:MAG TPA: hypothetical protein VGG79_12625 [Roseiarcus sp.]
MQEALALLADQPSSVSLLGAFDRFGGPCRRVLLGSMEKNSSPLHRPARNVSEGGGAGWGAGRT